nr:MAG TPA: hypothetical protein [Caudoviricetes sp.]
MFKSNCEVLQLSKKWKSHKRKLERKELLRR